MTLINNNTPEANKKALDEYLGRVSRKNEEAEWKTIKPTDLRKLNRTNKRRNNHD
jgi:hypothetical protein